MSHASATEIDHGFRQAYAFADGLIAASLAATDGDGIALSIDIGGSLFDLIARHRATKYGIPFSRFPTFLRHRSLRRRDGPSSQVASVLAEPEMLGRCDGSMRIVDEADAMGSYGTSMFETSTRSIDSWCNSRPPLRLIHFGDTELLRDQLAGARDTMERDAPIVTAYTSGTDRGGLLSLLVERGYAAVDLTGQPVEPDLAGRADFGWIALPRERLEAGLSVVGRGADQTMFTEWKQTMVRNAVSRQRQSSAVFGLPADAPELVTTISAEDLIADGNCHGAETDGRIVWRWLGPRPRTRIFLPCPLPGIYRIEISVMSPRLAGGSAEYRVLVEGREVRTEITGNTICVVGQLDEKEYTGFLTVDLVSLGAPISIGKDRHNLRMSIQSVTVSPWQ